MSLNVCPIATVQASAATVWSLLNEPASYDTWWDVTTDSITPAGLAQAGQMISAHTHAMGRQWKAWIRVDAVDQAGMAINLTTSLQLGITVLNHITVRSIDEHSCQLSFG